MIEIRSDFGAVNLLSLPRLLPNRACGRCALVLAGLFLTLSLAAPLQAAKDNKPSRTVTGVVSNAAEDPIAGAVVELTDLTTGKKSAAYTSSDGSYQYGDLEPTRDYEIQASYKGESSRVRKISSFDPRKRVVVNLRIPEPKEEE